MEINLLKTDVKDIGKLLNAHKKSAKHDYPSKTTLNLGVKPKSINSPSRAIPVFLVIMLVVAAFGKFGVSDRLKSADQAEAKAASAEASLAAIRAETADYESVRAEYDRRVFPELMVSEAISTDAMDILQLIEGKLMSSARVHSFAVQEPVINLQLSGITLDQASQLVRSLEGSPLVNSVMIYTADSEATPTPVPTPTPRPTRTPKPKKGQTPAPTPEAPVPTPTPESAVIISMTITLTQGGAA